MSPALSASVQIKIERQFTVKRKDAAAFSVTLKSKTGARPWAGRSVCTFLCCIEYVKFLFLVYLSTPLRKQQFHSQLGIHNKEGRLIRFARASLLGNNKSWFHHLPLPHRQSFPIRTSIIQ
jgi:hypothetical protein